ncbi:integrin beta-PS isoform X2 [Drosophila subobscura]|uniref:integrin beta-PS isoform X2 n=1 Tax=Drosophila subobscura TaxID=7241 RepID=UPI00155A932E|nr:integrin beta-PS isoform X2 [Drosophila subobscura]
MYVTATKQSCHLGVLSVLVLALMHASLVQCQLAGKLVQNPCSGKDKCHTCIQTQSCAWCMQPNFEGRSRCFQHTSPDVCPEQFVWNPDTSEQILINKNLTLAGESQAYGSAGGFGGGGGAGGGGGQYISGGSSYHQSSSSSSSSSSASSYGSQYSGWSASSGEIVQIKPQSVNLKLRINQVHNLKVSYTQAEGYPVDLYYLMDLSKSMEDDKEKLSALGDKLSETMKSITSNFRLGFGSFVDKVLMPYVSTIPKSDLEEPCPKCAAPYGYRNIMGLSTDTYRFSNEVKDAAVSGNLDAPEGGFDAIMQAIACRQQVGWREQARRLLVFSTDAGFHYAGDGKLGGVIAPNDGECHLDLQGMYTHSVIQDYPSISQINQKVKENAINIIFAVTNSQYTVYEKLAAHVQGSSAAILSNDSSNVVDLVQKEYNKISSSVEMKDNATGDVKITYFSSCLTNGPEIQTSKCDNLTVGKQVSFTAQIQVLKCPEDPRDWNQVIQIYPVGINESMVIKLEMLCSCPCEHPGSIGYEPLSPHCNNYGTYMCGICDCGEHHFGNTCECSVSDMNSTINNDASCRADNTTNVDCSGRGNCVCGFCECFKRPNPEEVITGKFCECENFSCERNKNQLCSGPDHGTCDCGRCVCKPGWTGSSCACQASNDTCMPPGGGELCSGHGTCECGVCKCTANDQGRYSGRHCEKCPTCSGRCQELKDCVQCQMYHTGVLKNVDDCARNCTAFTPVGVEKVTIDEHKDEQMCTFFDEDDCKFMFKYSEQGELVVHAQEEKECPPKVFMLGIVLGVIAAIVLVGLAILLLWKLLTTIHDRREFARFEKESMNAKWNAGENPIYKQATSTFKNPMYAGK